MLKNYLKLTWRNLARNSTYSIIIITGLMLAYSACLVIFLFVENETNYDRQSPDAERIYRVVQDISQIESTFRFTPTFSVKALTTSGSKSFYEQRIVGADSNMIRFFNLK